MTASALSQRTELKAGLNELSENIMSAIDDVL